MGYARHLITHAINEMRDLPTVSLFDIETKRLISTCNACKVSSFCSTLLAVVEKVEKSLLRRSRACSSLSSLPSTLPLLAPSIAWVCFCRFLIMPGVCVRSAFSKSYSIVGFGCYATIPRVPGHQAAHTWFNETVQIVTKSI